MSRIFQSALLLLPLAPFLNAQYVGSQQCRQCHAEKFETQSRSDHAHALAPAPPGSPGEWAFGAGAKAITYVSKIDPDTYVERARSYYASTKSMAPTPGHPNGEDRPYPTFDPETSILRCFRCHSTGQPKLGAGFTITPGENGVRCESCHGPGAAHVKAGGGAATILNPKRLNAVELNEFCGTCHRKAPEAGDEKDWSNSWNTRHQPTYLSQAACFRKSAGALSCLTCHDPHGPLTHTAADYDKRCNTCHAAVKHQAPVAARSCVGCHMPQAQTTLAQLRFTNHWIGVYRPGNALVPIRRPGRSLPPLVLPATAAGKVVPPNDLASLVPLFEQGVADLTKQFGPTHPKVARGLENLALFRSALRDQGGAIAPFRRAVEIDRANHDRFLPETEEKLAQALQVTGNTREAFELFRQSAAGADKLVAARSYASLALLDPAHADSYYRSALTAEEAASGPNHPRVAILLNDLALALKEKKDYQSAEPLLRRALAVQQKAYGQERYQTATTMGNLGNLLQAMNRIDEAEHMLREALRIFEQKLPESAELATTCTNLADIVATKGDAPAAAALLRRTLSIDEAIYGMNDPEVAGDLTNLGGLLREAGQPKAAQPLLERALAIYRAKLGPSSPEALEISRVLGH